MFENLPRMSERCNCRSCGCDQSFEYHHPDACLGGVRECGVVYRCVDTGQDCFVKYANAICGEEDGSLEILQALEEHFTESVLCLSL